MRRVLVIGSLALAVALTGCAPASDPDTTAQPSLTPMPGATYTETAPPSVTLLDLDYWAASFLPALASGDVRKSEVLHGGETEALPLTFAGGGSHQALVGCAADEPTTLVVAVDSGDGVAPVATSVACALGASAQPTVATIDLGTAPSVQFLVTATVDTALVVQLPESK